MIRAVRVVATLGKRCWLKGGKREPSRGPEIFCLDMGGGYSYELSCTLKTWVLYCL